MVKEQLGEAIKAAMRSHEKERLLVLRTIKSAVKQVEIDSREELDDEAVMNILQSQLKQREQAKQLYLQGERKDLAEKEEYEIGIIREFLPRQLTEEEMEAAVEKAVAELDVHSMKDMGNVMKHLKQELGSRADGRRLSVIVRNHLSKK